jgi:hypothetical protein
MSGVPRIEVRESIEEPPKTGRPKKIDIETVAQIQQELSDSQGFVSYREIQLWLLTCQD